MNICGIDLAPSVTATEHATREQWLEGRSGSIGASSVANILGFGWKTRLWEFGVMTGKIPPQEETEAMKWGHIMQPLVRDQFEEETHCKTKDWGDFTILRNEEFPGLHATVDYPVVLANGGRKAPGVLECKNVGAHMGDAWEEGLPRGVEIQIQAQLAITGWEWGVGAAIIGGNHFVYAFVDRCEEWIQYAASKLAEFLAAVEAGVEPPATAADGEALRMLHPRHVPGKEVALPGELIEVAERMEAGKRNIKSAEKQVDADRNTIVQAFGDAEIGVFPDGTRFSCKQQTKKSCAVKVEDLPPHMVKEGAPFRVLRRLKS